jgi:hypothetical protein
MSSRKQSPKGRRRKRQPQDTVGLYLSLTGRDIDAGRNVKDLDSKIIQQLLVCWDRAPVNIHERLTEATTL